MKRCWINEALHPHSRGGLLVTMGAVLLLLGCGKDSPFELAQKGATRKLEQALGREPGLLYSRDMAGRTLLHRAALGGRAETVQFLLSRGMSPAASDRAGFSSLDYARLSGSQESFEILLEALSLEEAISLENPDWVEAIVEKDPDSVHREGPGGNLPLHLALKTGNPEVIRRLLREGASPNDPFPQGESPLEFAVRLQQSGIANLLLEAGGDPDFIDPLGRSPLYFAIRNEDATMVVRLLESGADPNLVLSEGLTPIQLAAQKGNLQILQELVRHGAVLDSTNRDGRDALYWARKHHYFEMAHLIEEMMEVDDD